MNLPENPKFLLIRTDKIGDLILTTPAVQALKEAFPNSSITILASDYACPILENNPYIDHIIPLRKEHSLWNLIHILKEHRYDCSIHFFIDSKTALATFLSGIPERIGPFSKAASLFLNRRICQNRSQAQKHEAEYNLDIVRILQGIGELFSGGRSELSQPRFLFARQKNESASQTETPKEGFTYPCKIYLSDTEKKWGKEFLESIVRDPKKKSVLIHPGSKGSAQSWPMENFLELAKKIANNLGEVLFSGGSGEESLLQRGSALNEPNIHVIPAGSLSLRQFASVINSIGIVVSNSTGPLHMAVALDRPTLSFYPKLPIVTSAKRWGPYSKAPLHKVLEPQNPSEPMSSISVERAFTEISC